MNHRPSQLIAAVCLAISIAPASAFAIDPGACCVQSTSRLDSLMNPTKGSDEQFFSSGGAPPNVTLVLDTSCSMVAWPEGWPSAEGCAHTFAGNAYSPTTQYRGVVQGIAADGSPIYNPRWFDNSKIYSVNGSSVGHDLANSPSPTTWSGLGTYDTARIEACNSIIPLTYANALTRRAACNACVNTKGYFIRNQSGNVSRIASGNYLKYYAPRDVSALMVISQMLYDVREVRLSMVTFENWTSNGNKNCWRGGNYVCMWKEPAPMCNQLVPFDQTALTSSRNAILAELNTNKPFTTDTPVAASLYAAMYAMRSPGPNDAFLNMFGTFPQPHSPTADTVWTENPDPNHRRICSACGFNAVIVLTDGEPNENMITTWPTAITAMDSLTATTCSGGSCGSRLDEIAAFFWSNSSDIRQDPAAPGPQRVATYTIGFGTNAAANNLLASTAKVGGGSHFSANNASGIVSALQSIFEDINTRNTSFSSASVSAVQTGSSSTPAVLARVVPKKDQAWAGALWRFEQFNEFAEEADLNGDGDLSDVFIVDKPCTGATPCAPQADGGRSETADNIVTEDVNGNFVRLNGGAPARPYWEANQQLIAEGLANRKVWTIVDRNGDGAFTSLDEPLERVQLLPAAASAAYDDRAADYMGLKGSEKCPTALGPGTLLSRMGLVTSGAWSIAGLTEPTLPIQSDYDRLCTRLVIMWTLGYDLLNADPARKTTMRADVMGDVFHSSPIVVEPPFDRTFCDLGLSTQCVRTLYANDPGITLTPLEPVSPPVSVCSTLSNNAYQLWQGQSHRRQRVILVGGNDGMLHAFDNGQTVTNADECLAGKSKPTYGAGSGREVWAFIPPDQLPRLADQLLGHQYMVDGDVMVRDIWHDADHDNVKDANEFHTLAVMSEGRGGTHYLALEIQFDLSGDRLTTVKDRPGFRWMYPQPCSEESATFGKTFFALSPKAPPIGPVLFDNSTLPSGQRATGTAIARNGAADTVERWVVALSGGWSPGLEKGRGVYIVDAWEGTVGERRDNLWWKFEFDEAATGDLEPARGLRWSVTAPVALVDYGADESPTRDLVFDTAIWGDTAGQVWVARLFEPARFSNTLQRVDNWFAARTLELDRPASATAASVTNVQPFFYLPSVAIEASTDRLRAFLGSGNRYAVLERKAGMCRFDNPLACAKAGCDDTRVNYTRDDGLVNISKIENHWQSGTFAAADSDYTLKKAVNAPLTAVDTCGVVGTPRVLAEYNDFEASSCGISNTSPGPINETKYQCGMLNGINGGFSCQRLSQSRNGALGDLLEYDNINATGQGHNRFVGFWAYGAGRGFGGDAGTPDGFDDDRLSDRNGDLVDVTSVSCTKTSCTGGATSSADKGWFLDYADIDQKTATGAAVVASCVLWSDLRPTGGSDGGTCGNAPSPLSAVYQADFITGQPNCAFGFFDQDGGTYARSQQRTVLAPPPEPATVVQISKSGQLKYSAMLVEPGKSQATTVDVSSNQDVMQVVSELPISRALHNCRHADGGCVTSP